MLSGSAGGLQETATVLDSILFSFKRLGAVCIPVDNREACTHTVKNQRSSYKRSREGKGQRGGSEVEVLAPT